MEILVFFYLISTILAFVFIVAAVIGNRENVQMYAIISLSIIFGANFFRFVFNITVAKDYYEFHTWLQLFNCFLSGASLIYGLSKDYEQIKRDYENKAKEEKKSWLSGAFRTPNDYTL